MLFLQSLIFKCFILPTLSSLFFFSLPTHTNSITFFSSLLAFQLIKPRAGEQSPPVGDELAEGGVDERMWGGYSLFSISEDF